jgi:hypothetical protein
MNIAWTIVISVAVTMLLNNLEIRSFRRRLVDKAHDKMVEFINDKPYYIVPESEYVTKMLGICIRGTETGRFYCGDIADLQRKLEYQERFYDVAERVAKSFIADPVHGYSVWDAINQEIDQPTSVEYTKHNL